jgi:L-alanine-DL-glutamate epimerase-like enolase superfamily enzyme
MHCRLHRFPLTKAVPLAISRGTTAAVVHLLLAIEHEGIIGIGETGGFDTGHRCFTTDAVADELSAMAPRLAELSPEPLQNLEPLLADLSPPARCGLDLALHDCWAKRLGQPLRRLWARGTSRSSDTIRRDLRTALPFWSSRNSPAGMYST